MSVRNPSRVRQTAFTLIELLAVIAIILLLISLLVPALSRARDNAMNIRCRSNLHSVGAMMMTFASDHEGIMPTGGSTMFGALDWQKCWMGKEVLVGTAYEGANNLPATSWPGGYWGGLMPYMGNDPMVAKKLYRCIALDEGVFRGGKGSNGIFDYAMVMCFSGATLGTIPSKATLKYNAGDPTTWVTKPTPLVVEEDPLWYINNITNMEPGHGNNDRIGTWHFAGPDNDCSPDGRGNYVATDGSVNDCRPDLRQTPAPPDRNPVLNDWYTAAPKGNLISLGAYPGYNTWKDR